MYEVALRAGVPSHPNPPPPVSAKLFDIAHRHPKTIVLNRLKLYSVEENKVFYIDVELNVLYTLCAMRIKNITTYTNNNIQNVYAYKRSIHYILK